MIAAGILLAATLLALVLVATQSGGPVRVAAVLVVGLTAPGWVVTRALGPLSPALEWTVAIALSVAGMVVLSMVMLLAGAWHPLPAFSLYCLTTAVALAVVLLRRMPDLQTRRPRPARRGRPSRRRAPEPGR